MKFSGLLARRDQQLPGVSGLARVDRSPADLLRRVGVGEIAVIDQVDLDRRTADALVAVGVAGVVNAAPSISGRFPNLGPEVLVGSGTVLIDGCGPEVLHRIKDGMRVRLHEGSVFAGDQEIARGARQTAESVADQMIEAKAGMSAQLEAFSANTIEFLRSERMLVLDGVGVPELTVPMEDCPVLVVAPGHHHAEELRRLRRHIKEYRPVLVGVEAGAGTLRAAGYRPDVIVGDPGGIDDETLRCGAELVIPAHVDGYAPGLERIQDLGIGAVTFPAAGNPEDLALLLADAHGASLVISVGFQATLHEFLDQGRSGSNPSTFLTRLRLGSKLIDGNAVAVLQCSRVTTGAVLLLVGSALLVVLAALAVSGLGADWLAAAADVWNAVHTQIKGLVT